MKHARLQFEIFRGIAFFLPIAVAIGRALWALVHHTYLGHGFGGPSYDSCDHDKIWGFFGFLVSLPVGALLVLGTLGAIAHVYSELKLKAVRSELK